MFPELRAMVQYLYENRRLWNEMCLADIEADTFKTPAEKVTEKVCISHWHTCGSTNLSRPGGSPTNPGRPYVMCY